MKAFEIIAILLMVYAPYITLLAFVIFMEKDKGDK